MLFDFSTGPHFGLGGATGTVEEGIGRAAASLLPDPVADGDSAADSRAAPSFGAWLKSVTPTFSWDWPHLKLVRDVLSEVEAGTLHRVIIVMPPQHGKTEQMTIRYPIYRLERDPTIRFVIGAYGQKYANKLSRKGRRVGRGRLAFSRERNAVEDWETTDGGGVRAVGVGSGVTGNPADFLIIDDPVKSREEAESLSSRDNVWEWYTEELYTRLQPGAPIVIQMTRWHDDDLVGRILKSPDGKNWTVIHLPALAEQKDPLGRAEGEALCPERFDEEALESRRVILGDYAFAALYQGRPIPAGGGIVKREWWRTYSELPPVLEQEIQSWDFTFKATKGTDFVVGQVWARLGADIYLLFQVRGRINFPNSKRALKWLSKRFPKAEAKLIEDKANGPAIIDELRSEIGGLIAMPADGPPEARVHAVSPRIQAGNVYLPDKAIAERIRMELIDIASQPNSWLSMSDAKDNWLETFLTEWSVYPKAANDDTVMAGAQGLRRLILRGDRAPADIALDGELTEAAAVAQERF